MHEAREVRSYIDFSTSAASTVHYKLDYGNCVNYNLPKSQKNRLQQIQNSLAQIFSYYVV